METIYNSRNFIALALVAAAVLMTLSGSHLGAGISHLVNLLGAR